MSSSASTGAPDQALTIRRLGPKLHRIGGLLDHEEFALFEVEGDWKSEHQLLRKLIDHGALEKCGTVHENGTTRNRYRWVEGATEQFCAYLDEVTELPCGHRAHIYNSRGSSPDELGCKYCADGEAPAEDGDPPPFSKALVRERLSNQGDGD